jgi:hypothetical protein
MIAKDIREYIIKPALQEINLYCQTSEILVYGTGMCETEYKYLVQIGSPHNGGLSPWQIEPSDYADIFNWLNFDLNRVLLESILKSNYYQSLPQDPKVLIYNLKLAAMLCRVHYTRTNEPLPAIEPQAMAEYHKKHYNQGGKADVEKNTKIFSRIINGEF